MRIPRFVGGNDRTREKLNQVVDGLNPLLELRGDGQFIYVVKNTTGVVIGLALHELLCRIPKSSGGTASAAFATITTCVGTEPPYRYTATAAVMDEDGEWTNESGATEYDNVFNLEEQGEGGQWVNPLTVGDVVVLFAAPGGADAFVCMRSHYRGTY